MNYDTLNKYPFDPEKSKQLLAEAGYAGEPLKMVYWKDASNAGEYLPVIQQQLKDVGLNVDLQPLELGLGRHGDQPGPPRGVGHRAGLRRAVWPWAGEVVPAYGTCEGPKVQTGYQNCDLAKLFADARGTADPAANWSVSSRTSTGTVARPASRAARQRRSPATISNGFAPAASARHGPDDQRLQDTLLADRLRGLGEAFLRSCRRGWYRPAGARLPLAQDIARRHGLQNPSAEGC